MPALLISISLLAGCTNLKLNDNRNPEVQTTSVDIDTTAAEPAEMDINTGQDDTARSETSYLVKTAILSWNHQDVIPEYTGGPWTEVNGNVPYFADNEKIPVVFEEYAELDGLGRCGQAYASICQELMPTEDRENIGQVKPSGWHTVKYPDLISDLYLYNRCHLIGFQLAGENANDKNLITGTRYLNIEGMLPFENEVADHVRRTGHHVLYRATPIFLGDDLVCQGVEMEAFCVEDNGVAGERGISFHIFAYNVQPGIEIDYTTGDSWAAEDAVPESVDVVPEDETDSGVREYALNINSMKFHYPDCDSVGQANPKNIKYWTCSRDDLIEDGYSPCGVCQP